MKKICIFLNFSSSGGGIYQYAISLLDAFYLSDIKVEVLYNELSWSEVLKNYEKKFNLTKIKKPRFIDFISRIFLILGLPNFITRQINKFFNPNFSLIDKLNCDLIIFPYPDLISYQFNFKYLVAIHDLMHIHEPRFPEFSGFLRVFVRNKRFKNIIKNASGILVDSNVGKKHLMDYTEIQFNKIHVLPFVPPDYIRKKSKFKNFIINKFNLPEKYLFYPAKFWAHKNHIGLLKAIKLSKGKCSDLHFVFTGSKKHNYKQIYYWIRKLGLEKSITILGEVDLKYIRPLYLKSSGLFMPTFAGPTNIPPIEALMCNCPMAVSNIYGMKEQMKKASLYFNPNSINDMSKAIIKLWDNKNRKILLLKEGEKLKERLSILNHKKRILEIFAKVENSPDYKKFAISKIANKIDSN